MKIQLATYEILQIKKQIESKNLVTNFHVMFRRSWWATKVV